VVEERAFLPTGSRQLILQERSPSQSVLVAQEEQRLLLALQLSLAQQEQMGEPLLLEQKSPLVVESADR
jgi:hypothetical protein